jgi:hypothetical protein
VGPIWLVGLATAFGCTSRTTSSSSNEQAATGIVPLDVNDAGGAIGDSPGSGSFDARAPDDGSSSGSGSDGGGVADAPLYTGAFYNPKTLFPMY